MLTFTQCWYQLEARLGICIKMEVALELGSGERLEKIVDG